MAINDTDTNKNIMKKYNLKLKARWRFGGCPGCGNHQYDYFIDFYVDEKRDRELSTRFEELNHQEGCSYARGGRSESYDERIEEILKKVWKKLAQRAEGGKILTYSHGGDWTVIEGRVGEDDKRVLDRIPYSRDEWTLVFSTGKMEKISTATGPRGECLAAALN